LGWWGKWLGWWCCWLWKFGGMDDMLFGGMDDMLVMDDMLFCSMLGIIDDMLFELLNGGDTI